MTSETIKTYKFVRNTVLLITLVLTMFIPMFKKYETNLNESNVNKSEFINAIDSTFTQSDILNDKRSPFYFASNK